MNHAASVQNCIKICCQDEQVRILPRLEEQIEQCQRKLAGYLETKRDVFPRFCFVSDSVLLEILGNQSEPPKIQPYLNQIFDSINSVGFGVKAAQKNTILEMRDRAGESVELCRPVKAGGVIEAWLQQLIDVMRETLKIIIQDALENGKKFINDLQGLINEYPAQVALVALQVLWT